MSEIVATDVPRVALEAELEKVRTDTVSISEADFTESMRMAEEVGKVKMAQAISSGLTLGVMRWFSSMKESGAYKNKLLIGPDGKTFRPATFEQLCEGMGFSRRNVDEHLQNYAALGEQLLEEAQTLGLRVRDLRKVRKALKDASEEEKREVFARLKESSPEDMKTALDVVCSRYLESKKALGKAEKETEKLKEKVKTLEADQETQQQIAKERNDQIAELKEKLLTATSPVPSDKAVTAAKRNVNAKKRIDLLCNELFFATMKLTSGAEAIFADETMESDTLEYLHKRVSLAIKDAANVIRTSGIDVDLAAEFELPDWAKGETEEDMQA